jgi:hypothetical protein
MVMDALEEHANFIIAGPNLILEFPRVIDICKSHRDEVMASVVAAMDGLLPIGSTELKTFASCLPAAGIWLRDYYRKNGSEEATSPALQTLTYNVQAALFLPAAPQPVAGRRRAPPFLALGNGAVN